MSSIPLVSGSPTIIIGMDVSHGSPGQSDVPSIAAVISEPLSLYEFDELCCCMLFLMFSFSRLYFPATYFFLVYISVEILLVLSSISHYELFFCLLLY